MSAEDKTYFPKGSDNATPHSYQKNKVKLYMLIRRSPQNLSQVEKERQERIKCIKKIFWGKYR